MQALSASDGQGQMMLLLLLLLHKLEQAAAVSKLSGLSGSCMDKNHYDQPFGRLSGTMLDYAAMRKPGLTSNTPLSMVRMDTSKVPPPRSKTRMFCSLPFLSRP